MTDEEKPPPEYYAQGLHLTPEERRERSNEIIRRQTKLEESKAADALPMREPDILVATPDRLAKAETKNEKGEVIERQYEDFVTTTGRKTLRLLDGSILDRLFSKAEKHPIDGNQYVAGRQLQVDWDNSNAGKVRVVDTTRDAVDGGKMADITAAAMDALRRYNRAKKKVGPSHAHVLEEVLIFERTLEEYGKRYCFHRNPKLAKVAAKDALRRALHDLAFHYGLVSHVPIQVAHVEGYKPVIQPAS